MVYHRTSDNSKSRDVVVFLAVNIQWKEEQVIRDESGCLIIIKDSIAYRKVTLVNVYCREVE